MFTKVCSSDILPTKVECTLLPDLYHRTQRTEVLARNALWQSDLQIDLNPLEGLFEAQQEQEADTCPMGNLIMSWPRSDGSQGTMG
ncbi:hypothetical protein E2C01_034770 [Portunus trituberculatus]|uniref:Uncharacterized protein n=1 Tax=Portunus trituberculatus TaxID=210409 RepID=A0A5B7F9M4_PORTR|nr:hypothetical protein [Portunus trituberculatus]